MFEEDDIRYAGFLRRLVAYVIDAIICYAVIFLIDLLFMMGILRFADPAGRGLAPEMVALFPALVAIVVTWAYFAIFESSARQATLGKMAIGIKVTDVDGRRISLIRATGRFFAKILSGLILLIGYIMAAFTARKQALHDILAGTLVVVR